MVKVKLFADFASDADDLAAGFAEALRDWQLSVNQPIVILNATTSLVYNVEQEGIAGILTIVYREITPPEES